MNQLLQGLGTIPAVVVYLFVLLWLGAESTGVPLPNEIVLLLAGSLAAQGRGLSPVLLIVVGTAGSLAGASSAYAIGRRGGRTAVLRFGRFLRLDERRLDAVEAWFAHTGAFAIFIARITPFVRTVASFPAGMLRLNRRTFLLATLAGSLLWCTVMVELGNALGANYRIALNLITQYTLPAIVVLAALVAGYFWLHGKLARATGRPVDAKEAEVLREREREREREHR